ncbi:MAG: hypothetical protein O6913_05755, partial [Chloroflexi bacterium]|nr:hypothetical protein [Chloroflexota bacterium]
LTLFVFLLIYAFAGYKIWRLVRLLNRLSEDQLRARIDGFNVRFAELVEEGVFTESGLLGVAVGGYRRVQERRKPKRRRFRIPNIR